MKYKVGDYIISKISHRWAKITSIQNNHYYFKEYDYSLGGYNVIQNVEVKSADNSDRVRIYHKLERLINGDDHE